MRFTRTVGLFFAISLAVSAFVVLPAEGQSNRGVQRRPARAAKPTFLPSAREGRAKAKGDFARKQSVARLWNEALLEAIRRDTPRPTVHARNLFHVSAAMYDAWAAYDPKAVGYFRNESPPGRPKQKSQEAAISYAAYRVLSHRFASSPGHAESQARFDALMKQLGHNPRNTNTKGFSPAAVGNRIGQAIIKHGRSDGSNEQNGYADTTGYAPVNDPLIVEQPASTLVHDINRWQPLIVPDAIASQRFLTPHWSGVASFALPAPNANGLPLDPGPPPMLDGEQHDVVISDIIQLIEASRSLDPGNDQWINISPRVVGNNSLGAQDGSGHPVNPATGQPYPDNMVRAGDWGRVLAEFWADGPLSTTPPGHWNEIANEVSDHPLLKKRIGGTGPIVSNLEWDVKLYFALNAAVHDTAVATWGVKAYYDYGRPITVIREMALRGQSSDENLPNYDPFGLPLVPELVELVTAESSAEGERHAHLADHLGECAVYAWRGHPADPSSEHGGAGWVLGINWLPYQQHNFVTPPLQVTRRAIVALAAPRPKC
jgi:hypothetical protein